MGFNTDKWTFAVIVDDQARHSTANLRKAPMISIRPVDFDACCVLYVLEFVLFFFNNFFLLYRELVLFHCQCTIVNTPDC